MSDFQSILSLYCTPPEPIFAKTLTDFARSACVVAFDFIVCSDRVPTRTPPRTSRTRRVRPRPHFAFPYFSFLAGVFFSERNGRNGGSVGPCLCKGKAAAQNAKSNMVPSFISLWYASSPWSPSSASASDISARATRA